MFLRIELRSKKFYLFYNQKQITSPSYSFQKCIRSSDITVFTETSRTAILHEEVLQDSSAPIPAPIPAPMLHVHITLQSREFSIQNPILHTEDKELFEYYYYIQRAKDLHSRKEILRIEGKEIF